ncbi:MAG TPA: prephenate dehydrogenase/arogenate dehydrogenase family protein [Dehalococcoidia bacterium]|nr:prephenate dehydrogenase/arogenate dehydrogenase family protein [Dehalococcoidia bacterium]
MAVEKITIIGLGLVGGSIGLALKAAKLPNLRVVGHDLEADAMKEALRRGAVDSSERHLEGAVQDARLIIIATPPLAVRPILEDLAELAPEGCIVTDVASTKADVMRWAKQILPDGISFVGGHPMAGKEESGIAAAEADLFHGKAYAVIPATSATEGAVKSVLGLVSVLGADPVFIDAEEHDQYVAAISHMPIVLSTALFTLVRNSQGWNEIAPLASSGFKDLTRLASGDPYMNHDICATNPDGVVHWLDRMIAELRRYRDLIMDNHEELFNTFSAAQLQREAFLSGADRPQRERIELPSTADQMNAMLFGGWMADRYKKYEKMMRRSEKRGGAPSGPDDDDDDE